MNNVSLESFGDASFALINHPTNHTHASSFLAYNWPQDY